MNRKTFIFILLVLLVLTPSFGSVQTLQANEPANPDIESYTDRWQVVSKMTEEPIVDGSLEDSVWQEIEASRDFVTAYYNEPTDGDTGVKLAYDDENLYIAVDYTDANAGASLVNFGILLSPAATGNRYYHIPVKVRNADPRYVNNWGPDIETPEHVQSETKQQDDGVTAEIAVPLDAFGVDEVASGDEWRFNVIVQHEMGTKPMSSWVPVRRSSITYTGGSASVRADVTEEGRLGSIFMGELPTDGTAENEVPCLFRG